ncbi:hypothetical protein ACQ4PT_028818 [Festuca glaucescens]
MDPPSSPPGSSLSSGGSPSYDFAAAVRECGYAASDRSISSPDSVEPRRRPLSRGSVRCDADKGKAPLVISEPNPSDLAGPSRPPRRPWRLSSLVVAPTPILSDSSEEPGGEWIEVRNRCRRRSRSWSSETAHVRQPEHNHKERPVPANLHGLCFNCFSEKHRAKDCKEPPHCFNCRKPGHRLLDCTEPGGFSSDGEPPAVRQRVDSSSVRVISGRNHSTGHVFVDVPQRAISRSTSREESYGTSRSHVAVGTQRHGRQGFSARSARAIADERRQFTGSYAQAVKSHSSSESCPIEAAPFARNHARVVIPRRDGQEGLVSRSLAPPSSVQARGRSNAVLPPPPPGPPPAGTFRVFTRDRHGRPQTARENYEPRDAVVGRLGLSDCETDFPRGDHVFDQKATFAIFHTSLK